MNALVFILLPVIIAGLMLGHNFANYGKSSDHRFWTWLWLLVLILSVWNAVSWGAIR